MISDEDAEKAVDYLRDSAKGAAVARQQVIVLEKYLTIVEAEQKRSRTDMSNAAAQDAARASPEYRQAIDALGEAVKKDHEYKMLREAAYARVEAWRTLCSNARAG